MKGLSYGEMKYLKKMKQQSGLTEKIAYAQVGETLKAVKKVKPVKEKEKTFKEKFKEMKK